MTALLWHRGAGLLLALQQVPATEPVSISPRPLAAAGALLVAAMLGILYLYRGRRFILYWLSHWVLVAATMGLISRDYPGTWIGSVMLGLSALFNVWASGLMVLGTGSVLTTPPGLKIPAIAAAVTAVWFMAAPLLVPSTPVLASGAAMSAVLMAWASIRAFQLARRTRYLGLLMIAIGLLPVVVVHAVAVVIVASPATGVGAFDRLVISGVIANVLVGLGMHLSIFEDMTDELQRANSNLASANDEVRRLAVTDPLTGCHNRHSFDEIERREVLRHHRYQSPLSIVFVDVDGFKHVNDTLGHDTGDVILRAIGTLLRAHVRGTDAVIRWGGDEFLLLLSCTAAQAEARADELRSALLTDPETVGLPGGVGLSIGVAEVSLHADSLQSAIRRADERMYHDKSVHRVAPALQRAT